MVKERTRAKGDSTRSFLDGSLASFLLYQLSNIPQDFILSDTGDLFPIECNPRIHTAICLLRRNPTFAHAYLSTTIEGIAKPPAGTKPCSWLGHDIPACFLAAVLPRTESVHPYWEGVQVNELNWDTYDPTFDSEDPLPFFGLYHVQWTWVRLPRSITETC